LTNTEIREYRVITVYSTDRHDFIDDRRGMIVGAQQLPTWMGVAPIVNGVPRMMPARLIGATAAPYHIDHHANVHSRPCRSPPARFAAAMPCIINHHANIHSRSCRSIRRAIAHKDSRLIKHPGDRVTR
jgi:hypothetical protein